MEMKIPSRIKRKRNIKIKKSTLGIFAVMFAFVFAMFHVFAGVNNKITVEGKASSRGSNVTLAVNLECVQEYNSALVELQFDTDVLEYVKTTTIASVANPAAYAADPDEVDQITLLAVAPNKPEDITKANEDGVVSLGYLIDGETACENIELARVRFKVKEDAPMGRSAVTLSTATTMAKEVAGVKTDLTVDKVAGYVELALPVDPDSVALANDTFEIAKGGTDTIVVNFEPEETTDDKTVTYSGYDEDVITVDADGTIHAVGTGTTAVTVTAFGKTMTANVTVTNHITAVNVTSAGNVTSIEKDEQLQLTGQVVPDDTDDSKVLTWSSSSDAIAEVNPSTGLVTGRGTGTATITATSVNGIKGTFQVSVVVPITSFTTTDADLQLNKNATHSINYTIEPEETSESKVVNWATSNSDVATVSDGVISAVGGGTAVITGTLTGTKNNIEPITINVTVNVPLNSVDINSGNLALLPGQSQTVTAVLDPSDATHHDVVWSSTVPGVATVDGGTITAVAPGDTVIKARVDAEDKEDTISVHVLKPITEVAINKPTVTLEKNGTDTLSLIIGPTGYEDDDTVTWVSGDPSKVSVDNSGKITGKVATTTPVRVTGTLPNGMSAYSDVTVVVPLNDISLNKSTMTLNKDASEKLIVSYDPSDTTDDKTVTWSVAPGGESYVSVADDGTVTANAKGVATVIATVGTHSKSCQVTVNVPVSSVTIGGGNFTLARGTTKDLDATVTPGDASNPEVSWESTDTSVATVDSNGVVTAVKKGEATIKATADGVTGSVKVTVNVPITKFTTPNATKEILRKSSYTIPTTIEPGDTDQDKTITWVSGTPSVASVDTNGKVTGLTGGTSVITGTLPNGMQVTVTVTVTTIPVMSLTASETSLDMLRNDTTKLTVSYLPTNATEVSDVVWTVDNPAIASVEADGTVTALKEGETTVHATMGSVSADIPVKVTEIALEGVTLDNNSTETEVGKPFKITPSLEPFNATDDVEFTYESSDPEVATVDANGNVTTKKSGTVRITVKASNGVDEFEDFIELTVKAPSSPQTGVTPIWVYGGIIAILLALAVVIYKRKELI